MSLTLKILGRHGQQLGDKAEKIFGQYGGTIGRSLEADWSLPDAQRFLSSRHASIDFRSGAYYIVDMSKNGVFINDADEPVGRGAPQRLFTGDKIRIGDYEISVSITNVDDTRETLLNRSHVDPVDLRQRVDAPEPTIHDLVEPHVITGVGIEMFLEEDEVETLKPLYDKFRTGDTSQQSLSLQTGAAPAKTQPPKPPVERSPAAANERRPTQPMPKRTMQSSERPSSPPPQHAPSVSPERPTVAPYRPPNGRRKPAATPSEPADRAVQAFFRGAGIDAGEMSPEQVTALMTQLGQVTRELIVGIIDCLHLRALQKAQLKQANTIIQPHDNNRLKFAANFEEGFSRLFRDDSEQYLSPVESVRSAFADLKNHQRALLAAIRRAVDEYLQRIDPDELEQRASNGRAGTLINAANRFKYWDVYKDVFAILGNRAPDELPQPFLDALSKAYAEEIDKASGQRSKNSTDQIQSA